MSSAAVAIDVSTLRLLGGTVSLDFVNTVDDRPTPDPVEYLLDYGDVLTWASRAGALPESSVERLAALADSDRAAAARAAGQLRGRRERLYGLLKAHALGEELDARARATIAQWCGEAVAHAQPEQAGDRLVVRWSYTEPQLLLPWWPVAYDAWQLLTTQSRARLRVCPGHDCEWLFLDSSRSGTRRWCSMDGCGSRVKMRRAYERKKQRARRTG